MTTLSVRAVPGLELVLGGDLPAGALVLCVGQPGAGKTILTSQLLFDAARQGVRALVFTLFSESHVKLLEHLAARGGWAVRGVAGLAGVGALAFLVILSLILLGGTSEFVYGVPPWVWLLMTLPPVVVVLSVVALGGAVVVWKEGYLGLVGRVHYTLVVLALLGFVWFFTVWTLLGFRFG